MEDPTLLVSRLRQVRDELEMFRPIIEDGLKTIAPHAGPESIAVVRRKVAEIDAIAMDLDRHLSGM
jgi:hypothetical protein